MRKRVIMKRCMMVVMLLLGVEMQLVAQISWEQVGPGVWKGVVGTPENYSLLKAAGAVPKWEGLSRLPEVTLPVLASEIGGNVQDGKTALYIPLQPKEQLYGFGLNFQTIHQRGKILNLHVDHYGGTDNGRTHAPVPFYISNQGYGILVNSARYLTVYAGSGIKKDSPNAEKANLGNDDLGAAVLGLLDGGSRGLVHDHLTELIENNGVIVVDQVADGLVAGVVGPPGVAEVTGNFGGAAVDDLVLTGLDGRRGRILGRGVVFGSRDFGGHGLGVVCTAGDAYFIA